MTFHRIELPEDIINRLGKTQDIDLAKAAGVHFSTIFRRRQELGIPAFPGAKRNPKINIPEKIISRLGKVPDRILAKEANVSPATIAARRYKLGIMAYQKKNRVKRPGTLKLHYSSLTYAVSPKEIEKVEDIVRLYPGLKALDISGESGIGGNKTRAILAHLVEEGRIQKIIFQYYLGGEDEKDFI